MRVQWIRLLAAYMVMLAASTNAQEHWDLMVIAPHPDDETLGAGGVMMQALAQGKRVGVVVLTNGDGYPLAASTVTGTAMDQLTADDFKALAAERQGYLLNALSLIKLPAQQVHFLAYPDGGLLAIHNAKKGSIYTNTLTGQDQTYPAKVVDYHRAHHQKPAPYQAQSIIADLSELIRRYQPKTLYVTSAKDSHPDHQAAYHFIQAALSAAQMIEKVELWSYLVHSGAHSKTGVGGWPWPYHADLQGQFQVQTTDSGQVPEGLAWPPIKRVALTPTQAQTKLDMINQFEVEIETAADYMRAFAKGEEVFWRE